MSFTDDAAIYRNWKCHSEKMLFYFFLDWTEILAYFRGSELQNYFTKILEDDLKAVIKPQYVDQVFGENESWQY